MDPNRQLIVRYYEEMWNHWRFELIPTLIANDIVFRGSLGIDVSGHAGFRRYMETIRGAFPDFQNIIEELIVENDRIVARLTYRGTHSGTLLGVPATGQKVEYAGVAIFRIRESRIASGWVLGDTASLRKQIGATPTS